MFSTFTTKEGETLIIRSQDIRQLSSRQGETLLCWEICGEARYDNIQGTPADNLQRLAKEELDAYTQAQAQQQRATQGYPVPPVMRGRK